MDVKAFDILSGRIVFLISLDDEFCLCFENLLYISQASMFHHTNNIIFLTKRGLISILGIKNSLLPKET